MSAGPTSERVQQRLKRLIMERHYRPGTRLEPAELASALASSTTPIREALNHLVGVGLVESRSGSGFLVPLIDEPGLKDLYGWSGDILALALRSSRPVLLQAIEVDPDMVSHADRSADLFHRIAATSRNREHTDAMARINSRLHPARLGEPDVLDDVEAELDGLIRWTGMGDVRSLRRAVSAYHLRRHRTAARLLHDIYRGD